MVEKTEKLWGGRFRKELDEDAKKFSYSFEFDKRLFPSDIKTNLAHAMVLEKAGIILPDELEKIKAAFEDIRKVNLISDDEDIHSFIERLLIEKLGDLGKKIHAGKSRNDQVMTDVRLYLKEEIEKIIKLITNLRKTLYELAKTNIDIVFPGFTHFQTAQPVLLSHHLLAYYEKFTRDQKRFSENLISTDVCPLGSGALAGNNYGLDREFIAKELGFSQLSNNSMDAVSERDFMLEFLSNTSICMTHLSRFCEELIIWNSPIVGFIELDDSFTTGSSIMPQKKNPDIAELIRGKAGRALGNYAALTNTIKGLPLTYNRDLQEDKESLFDSIDTVKASLLNFSKMLGGITFNKDNIKKALGKGYILATEVADYLAQKGVPFRDAHEITGKIVLNFIEKGEALSINELKAFSPQIEEDIYEVLNDPNYEKAVKRKDVYGGTATNRVQEQLQRIKEENQWET
ncbi:argininosuccinate lyase [Candidatus Margulisiibacteriota bacterium]